MVGKRCRRGRRAVRRNAGSRRNRSTQAQRIVLMIQMKRITRRTLRKLVLALSAGVTAMVLFAAPAPAVGQTTAAQADGGTTAAAAATAPTTQRGNRLAAE